MADLRRNNQNRRANLSPFLLFCVLFCVLLFCWIFLLCNRDSSRYARPASASTAATEPRPRERACWCPEKAVVRERSPTHSARVRQLFGGCFRYVVSQTTSCSTCAGPPRNRWLRRSDRPLRGPHFSQSLLSEEEPAEKDVGVRTAPERRAAL